MWTNGPMTKADTTQPFTQTVGQRLLILLLSFKNEWFWNTEYGIPYMQSILGKKTTKARVDLIYSQAILSDPGVKEITYFNSTFVNRVYSLQFKVRVVDGTVSDIITVNPIT